MSPDEADREEWREEMALERGALRSTPVSIQLGREIILRWATFYWDGAPIHRVCSLAGSSPSPIYAARRLRTSRES
jgi:hypothetical protein